MPQGIPVSHCPGSNSHILVMSPEPRTTENIENSKAIIKFPDFSMNVTVVDSEEIHDGYRLRLEFSEDVSLMVRVSEFIHQKVFFVRSDRGD